MVQVTLARNSFLWTNGPAAGAVPGLLPCPRRPVAAYGQYHRRPAAFNAR